VDPLEPQEPKESKDLEVRQEPLAPQVPLATPVPLGLSAVLDPQVLWEPLDFRLLDFKPM
jgi:hypothetical protein